MSPSRSRGLSYTPGYHLEKCTPTNLTDEKKSTTKETEEEEEKEEEEGEEILHKTLIICPPLTEISQSSGLDLQWENWKRSWGIPIGWERCLLTKGSLVGGRRKMVKPQITDHLFPLPHRMESAVNASSLRSPCDLTLPEFVVYFYVQPTICLIGFVLNIINCQVFRKPDFVGPEYKMMIALSVTDAITLLCTFPLGFQRWVPTIYRL
ncbi:hypothetical protein EGR_06114 [Echinococcus granulosus]|uniref:G-protein coupled receptors family 1 profile domain-containing protein n=1 Tax=Echinococcus granulosus TaxID=6210 RepID=W6UDC7_ECHGR|nr:hypothetical protein EGR_06114 [Echinococcus granulosus]EUB58998.1 hypothetical protein EGR_06114 [Echinococcus granulosus]